AVPRTSTTCRAQATASRSPRRFTKVSRATSNPLRTHESPNYKSPPQGKSRIKIKSQRQRTGVSALHKTLVRAGHAAILFQPLQLFSHFDLSVPGVLIEFVSLAGKNQQVTRNIQFVQGAIEQVVLEHCDANVVRPGNHVGWRADFIELINRALATIAISGLPGQPSEVIGVVEGGVVVAPVGDVLDRAGTGDGGLEASGLRDQPVGHVTAVAVAADGQAVRVGNAVFYQRIDTRQYIFAGTGNEFRNDLEGELVSVAGRAAIVRLENQPAGGGGEAIPLIP